MNLRDVQEDLCIMQTNLERENEQLKVENERLVAANALLEKEKQRLVAENQQLKIDKSCIDNVASMRKHVVAVTRSGRSVVAAAAQIKKEKQQNDRMTSIP